MPGAGSKMRKAAKRRYRRRNLRAKQRAASVNDSQHETEGGPSQAQVQQSARPVPPVSSVQSDWDAYATDPDLRTFENCAQENLQILFKGIDALTEDLQLHQIGGEHAQLVTMRMNAWASIPFGPDGEVFIQPFGDPGPRHPRFVNLIHQVRRTMSAPDPGQRILQHVLKDYPEVKFLGMTEDALNMTAESIFEATLEVILKWFRKWLPHMKLSRVFDLEDSTQRVPGAALEMRFTNKTLSELYDDFREVYAAHGVDPQPRDIALIADACIAVCRVFKDEKMAYLIDKIKDAAQWLHISLGCKLLEVQGEASRMLNLGTREEGRIIESAFARYNLHRAISSCGLLKQTNAFVKYTQLSDSDDVLYPGESDDEDDLDLGYWAWFDNSEDSEDSDGPEDLDEGKPKEVEVIVISDSE